MNKIYIIFKNQSFKKTKKMKIIIIILLIISLYYVNAFTPAERALAWAKLQSGKGYSQAQCNNSNK
jgi:hypothetical protein